MNCAFEPDYIDKILRKSKIRDHFLRSKKNDGFKSLPGIAGIAKGPLTENSSSQFTTSFQWFVSRK